MDQNVRPPRECKNCTRLAHVAPLQRITQLDEADWVQLYNVQCTWWQKFVLCDALQHHVYLISTIRCSIPRSERRFWIPSNPVPLVAYSALQRYIRLRRIITIPCLSPTQESSTSSLLALQHQYVRMHQAAWCTDSDRAPAHSFLLLWMQTLQGNKSGQNTDRTSIRNTNTITEYNHR